MEARIEALIEHIRKLETAVLQQKTLVDDVIITNNAVIQKIVNLIEIKLDILCNSEALTQKTVKKIKIKLSFFKDKLKEDINTYLGELYESSDIERLMSHEEVVSRKNEMNKIAKIGDLLYKEINKDAARGAKLSELYEAYKVAENET